MKNLSCVPELERTEEWVHVIRWMTKRIDYLSKKQLIARKYCGVEKWLSRRAHNSKVVGSNPTPATKLSSSHYFAQHRMVVNSGDAVGYCQQQIGYQYSGLHPGPDLFEFFHTVFTRTGLAIDMCACEYYTMDIRLRSSAGQSVSFLN